PDARPRGRLRGPDGAGGGLPFSGARPHRVARTTPWDAATFLGIPALRPVVQGGIDRTTPGLGGGRGQPERHFARGTLSRADGCAALKFERTVLDPADCAAHVDHGD